MSKVKMVNKIYRNLSVTYEAERIKEITHDECRRCYIGKYIDHDVRFNDSILIVRFIDGSEEYFGNQWSLTIE